MYCGKYYSNFEKTHIYENQNIFHKYMPSISGQPHSSDKFKKGIREVFFSFQGGLSKMYRIYRKSVNSFQGDFLILLKVVCFRRNLRAHFRESP